MTQLLLEVLIVGLFTGLGGIIWMIVHNYFDDDRSSKDNRIGETPLSKPHDWEESQEEQSSRKSKAAA